MTRFVSLLAIAIAFLPTAAAAQDAPVKQGARVRVWTSPASAPFIGTVTDQDGRSFTLHADGFDAPVTVQRTAISRLELKVGGRSTGKSIRNGALVGLALAVVAGLASGDDEPNTFVAFSGPEKALLFSILTVPAGILTGALVGSSPDRWAPVPLPANRTSQAASVPTPSLRMSLRF